MDYPLLRAYAAHYARSLDRALDALADGTQAGQIRQVVYHEALRVISRSMESVWDRVVAAPFFYNGGFQRWRPLIGPVLTEKSVTSYVQVPGLQRLIAQAPPTVQESEPVRAMTSLLDEWSPLVAQIQALKPLVVKGRAPTAARPENPDQPFGRQCKIVRTCACCQRAAALTPQGLMVHHGYRRPGDGQQTASCFGVCFPPWERSKAGGEAIRARMAAELAVTQRAYDQRETRTELSVLRRDRQGRLQAQTIQRTDPQWGVTYQDHVRKLADKLTLYRKELLAWDARLAAWRPTEPETMEPTRRRRPRSGPSADPAISNG